jgi:hypothetical protein
VKQPWALDTLDGGGPLPTTAAHGVPLQVPVSPGVRTLAADGAALIHAAR